MSRSRPEPEPRLVVRLTLRDVEPAGGRPGPWVRLRQLLKRSLRSWGFKNVGFEVVEQPAEEVRTP